MRLPNQSPAAIRNAGGIMSRIGITPAQGVPNVLLPLPPCECEWVGFCCEPYNPLRRSDPCDKICYMLNCFCEPVESWSGYALPGFISTIGERTGLPPDYCNPNSPDFSFEKCYTSINV